MTYDPTIPTDSPPPNVAVTKIKTNFSQFGTEFALNHVGMNDSNQGKHTNVIFQAQLGDPEITGNFDAVYCKSVTSNSGTSVQLFLKIPAFLPSSQPNLAQQLTFNSVNTSGPIYQSFLPGGYIMYFGSVSSVPATITLSPAPTKILCAVANANNISGGVPFDVYVTILNNSQFTIKSGLASGSYSFSWTAIAQQ